MFNGRTMNCFSSLLSVCTIVCTINALPSPETINALPSSETSEHDNHVLFVGVSAVSYNVTSWTITGGQPSSLIPCQDEPCGHDLTAVQGNCCAPENGDLCFKAGRHGSAGPAGSFKNGLTALNCLGLDTESPLTTMPGSLNFAAIGDLSLTFRSGNTHTCKDIRIGQGHVLFKNNWWIASSKCYGVPDSKELTCKPDDIPLFHCPVSFSQGNDDNSFQVNEVTVEVQTIQEGEAAIVSTSSASDGCQGALADANAGITMLQDMKSARCMAPGSTSSDCKADLSAASLIVNKTLESLNTALQHCATQPCEGNINTTALHLMSTALDLSEAITKDCSQRLVDQRCKSDFIAANGEYYKATASLQGALKECMPPSQARTMPACSVTNCDAKANATGLQCRCVGGGCVNEVGDTCGSMQATAQPVPVSA